MRVYIAGSAPVTAAALTARFGDECLDPALLVQCVEGRESMILRLAALERCDAIYLGADWRSDPRAVVEKAFADYLRIPEVRYCLPRKERKC